jgi:hypothetical protein
MSTIVVSILCRKMFYTIVFYDNLVNLLIVCTTNNLPQRSAPWMNSLGRAYIRRDVPLNNLMQKLLCHVDPYNPMCGTKRQAVHRVVV